MKLVKDIMRWLASDGGRTQSRLAELTGLKESYLSDILNGRAHPGPKNEAKIRKVIGPADDGPDLKDELVPLTRERTKKLVTKEVWGSVLRREREYNRLEEELGQPSYTCINFWHVRDVTIANAITAARYARSSCGAGTMVTGSIAALLDNRRVRLHFVDMENDESSASFHNPARGTISILLNRKHTPERQTYRLGYELSAAAFYFGTGRTSPFTDKSGTPEHEFCRKFTSEFLMPEDSVRQMVDVAGVLPEQWTLEVLNKFKPWFNVSAQALALRLKKLGLMTDECCTAITTLLEDYYKKHKKKEPKPFMESLPHDVRYNMLLEDRKWRKGHRVEAR